VIPVRAKVLAVLTMAASLSYMIFVADVRIGVAGITGLIMLAGALFILRQPSRIPDQDPRSGPHEA
jgi:uncharacterized membrane protein YbaN (DUF454 family)